MTDISKNPKHPAKFSPTFINEAGKLLQDGWRILDPMAGIGGIHVFKDRCETWGLEIEPEWAQQATFTVLGDATRMVMWPDHWFNAIVTSPPFGNRMADHHEAKDDSQRHTYRHYLGRPLSKNNIGGMQWGPEYRKFMTKVWKESYRVLRVDGLMIVHIGDHFRKHKIVPVSKWTYQTLRKLGLEPLERKKIAARKNRHGANYDLRVAHEYLLCFRKGRSD